MTTPEVHVSTDAPALASYVAQRLLTRLSAAQAEGRQPHVGLTGGTIASEIYREVARLGPDSSVDWANVVFWWGDERFVAAASPDRNAGQARAAFLDELAITPHNIHTMPSSDSAPSADRGAEIYGDLLRSRGAGEFDVLLLGVGPDGHVASLFPDFPQLNRDDTVAVGVHGSPKPPPERITLTLPALNRSRDVWFLASGAEKAWAVATAYTQSLAEASRNQADTSRKSAEASRKSAEASLPAARVRGRLSTIWFLDRAAAADLA